MLFRKQLILAKAEETYGVDPTPTAAANSILCGDVTLGLMQGDTFERNNIRPDLGLDKLFHVSPLTTLEFTVEWAGANGAAADSAPAYAPLLAACGLSGAAAATPTRYQFTLTDSPGSVTIYYHLDGVLHEMNGARGNIVFTLGAKQIPNMRFRFQGSRVAPVAVALPTDEDFGDFATPIPMLKVNTPTATLDAYSINMESWTLDMGNDVQYRNLVNVDQIIIANRAPQGRVVFEEPAIGTKDFHALVAAHNTHVLQIVHGTVAKNKIQIDAPAVQMVQPENVDSQGQRMLSLNLRYVPAAGLDEYSFATL